MAILAAVLAAGPACNGSGAAGEAPDLPAPTDEAAPPQCQGPVDCPERECLVTAGCVDGQCRYTPVFSPDRPVPCTPSTPCFEAAHCNDRGECITDPGSRRSCDDGNPCTSDSCDDRSGSCSHAPLDGPACDDGEPCTGDDLCSQGLCRGRTLLCACLEDKDCPAPENRCLGAFRCVSHACEPDPTAAVQCPASPDPCKVLRCRPADGACVPENGEEGTPCDDLNACTVEDACHEGACQGKARPSCDDGDPCTTDSCDSADGTCRHEPLTGTACDDGDPCTEPDSCVEGACHGGDVVAGCCHGDADCRDQDSCTADSCDTTTHQCRFTPIVPCCGNGQVEAGEQCDDGNPSAEDGCSPRCDFLPFRLALEAPVAMPLDPAVALSEEQDRFLVVLHSYHTGLYSASGIFGQVVDLEGNLRGSPVRIQQHDSLTLRMPAVTTDANGGFLVAWRDTGVTWFRPVDRDGTPLEPEQTLSLGDVQEILPEVTDIGDMERRIALASFRSSETDDHYALLVWKVSATDPVTSQVTHRLYHALLLRPSKGPWSVLQGFPKVLALPNPSFLPREPVVAANPQVGEFLLMWTAQDPANSHHWEHRMARIDRLGTVKQQVLLQDYPDSAEPPILSGGYSSATGLYLLVSPELGIAPSWDYSLNGRLYDLNLNLFKSSRLLLSSGHRTGEVRVFPAGNGNFVATWLESRAAVQGSADLSILAQNILAGFYFLGSPAPLHSVDPALRFDVAVAPHPRGGFFAVWSQHQGTTLSLAGRMTPRPY